MSRLLLYRVQNKFIAKNCTKICLCDLNAARLNDLHVLERCIKHTLSLYHVVGLGILDICVNDNWSALGIILNLGMIDVFYRTFAVFYGNISKFSIDMTHFVAINMNGSGYVLNDKSRNILQRWQKLILNRRIKHNPDE